MRQHSRGRGRPIVGALSALVVVTLAAACSSAGSSASTAGSSGQNRTSSAQLSAAAQVVAEYSQNPTALGQTTPLTTRPPTGKTIVWMQCALESCTEIGDGIAAAAAALGWTLKKIPYDQTTPSTLISGMQQALQYKPVAVSLSGLAEATWQTVLPAYKAAGVSIIPISVGPVPVAPPVPAAVSVQSDFAKHGDILGDWFISASHGEGHALAVGIPALPPLAEITGATVSTIQQGCSGCTVTTLNATLAEAGGSNGLAPAIISALKKDRSINYVLVTDGDFTTGLVQALKAAGLGNVQLATCVATVVDEENIKVGTEAAATSLPLGVTGWLMVDATLRIFEHMPVSYGDGGLPVKLVTKANVGTPSGSLNEPANYAALFEKLWKIN
jgi:ribose transport system substrate-binding protein